MSFLVIHSREVETKSFFLRKFILCFFFWWFSVKLSNYGSCLVYGWRCWVGSETWTSSQPERVCGFSEIIWAHRSRIFQGEQEIKHYQSVQFLANWLKMSFVCSILKDKNGKCTLMHFSSTFLSISIRNSLKFSLYGRSSDMKQSIHKEQHSYDWKIMLNHSQFIDIQKSLISMFSSSAFLFYFRDH